jgi:hypothetical protein
MAEMPASKRPAREAGGGITLADDQPVVVNGDPRRLSGTLRLRNDGEEAARVERVVVRDPEGNLGLTAESAHRVSRRALDPAGEIAVKLRLRLDERTPPGEYHAEVEVGGTTRQLVVQVAQRVSVDLEPRRILVANQPGGTTTASVVVTNQGNVAVTVGEIGAVPLDDEQRDCRILRRTVDALTADEREVSVERLLTEVTRASKQVLEEAGVLRIRNLSGPAEVPPGAVIRFDLSIEVPTTLDPHARYTGLAPIATGTLGFVVVPGIEGGVEPSAPPKRATRRAARSARPTNTETGSRPRRSRGQASS